ncbi:glutamine synthetase family protein [Rhodobacter capsulatus]|jgi:glutamine synthetase|uniref:Glutamine synthetase-2 n=1 Tax=Rhodobacter capsulatus (strain ATCC BAA-309 / NBRC 16581 / SB1003) TaxID=272942 RepID=D5AT16_RHOCB|nr:glutamine synthetase family protein [Rhodobacter capsulatus]ADE85123.1 glutamine synthetase-2 [Rhodobacter capsulatus SB 1003]ETD02132.1 glutamine synthetase [Rhodobacter capsulatus DE442]ETD77806.1 glutamine synthetase [Rhodobacter capsulatus R121]ETE54164.1 glutamine synthetase [Rhodobacter capsulatus Y262]MDS0926778.1 glutamine synthetase family protein [Rhodobacter capsulatus]
MPANLTFAALTDAVAKGEIDTVITCLCDMQGRLQGKRFHAAHFLESAHEETHCCNYLLATDMEMITVPGYKASSWSRGYGDYVMKPDLATLRRIPWAPGTALVMCDVLDHHTHELVAHAPRTVLKRQIERAKAMGFDVMMATELEFFLFEESFPALFDAGYPLPTPMARYNVDYNLMGSARDEKIMRDIRNKLYGAGIPIECSKGEAEAGQEEINAKYSDALDTADMHSLIKLGVKEIAQSHGASVTFMAKYDHRKAGSSSHIHQSLWKDDKNAFHDPAAEHGMSAVMRHFLAGQLAFSRDIAVFLAPYMNSYKRFCVGMFAPTKAVWSLDNRTAGYRICGENTKSVRVECRIGGADLNPYLACAALLAAGLEGIEQMLDPGQPVNGDLYQSETAPEIPRSLIEAAEALKDSSFLSRVLGAEVVEHYYHAARWEIEESLRVVTDWERHRGFERA